MGKLRRGRRVREGRAETDMIRRKGKAGANLRGLADGMGYAGGTPSYGGSELVHEGRRGRARWGEGGRSEKSSAAYVGFRARLAAAATALIRVRRYEIIKLGLDGGEGDGGARRGGDGERKRGKAERGKRRRWMSEARWDAGCQREGRGEGTCPVGAGESRRITVFRIYWYMKGSHVARSRLELLPLPSSLRKRARPEPSP